jgi:flagellar basal body rod protein FlgG
MDRGLYIAASGMLAVQIRQDQIANDLANTSTPSDKSDRTTQRSFGALLLANTTNGAAVGRQSTAVQVDAIETDSARAPRARPASRSTSRSPARASSPSRPPRASATPATASSRSTPRAGS